MADQDAPVPYWILSTCQNNNVRIKRTNVKTQAVMRVRKQRGSEDFWLATEGGKQHYYIGLGCASATRLAGEHGKIPRDGLRWPRVG